MKFIKPMLVPFIVGLVAASLFGAVIGALRGQARQGAILVLDDRNGDPVYLRSDDIDLIDLEVGNEIVIAPAVGPGIEDSLENRRKLCIPNDLDGDIPGFVRLEGPTSSGDVAWVKLYRIMGVKAKSDSATLVVYPTPSWFFGFSVPDSLGNRSALGLPTR